uniref:(northern house mosquito) hypothetical protein n=1 Tax=Culex pipiens TaxID=7175 RepID=A0A8D8EUM7_CULPI
MRAASILESDFLPGQTRAEVLKCTFRIRNAFFTFYETDKNNKFVSSILPSSLCRQQDKLKLSMNLATRFCFVVTRSAHTPTNTQNSQKRQTPRKKGENFTLFPLQLTKL